MATTLAEQIAIEPTEDGGFVSKLLPTTMGSSVPIAYGGITLGIAVNAACSTVPEKFSLYSALGHYLGPGSITEKMYCTVEKTRDGRSFATRRVQVKQKQPDDSFRVCLDVVADFHVAESALLTYSAPPVSSYPKPEDCPEIEAHMKTMLARGEIGEELAEMFTPFVSESGQLVETRVCLNGVSGQNLSGMAHTLPTTQDKRHITAKTSAEWGKVKHPIESKNAAFGALAFIMDAGLAFLPLLHNHQWMLEDVVACSSLDFALRVFTPELDLNSWHMKERMTSQGGSGRTYSEGKVWDSKGNLVASMTQVSILRPTDDATKSVL